MNQNNINQADLKPYEMFGKIPLLKLLFTLTVVSLSITAIYEFVL